MLRSRDSLELPLRLKEQAAAAAHRVMLPQPFAAIRLNEQSGSGEIQSAAKHAPGGQRERQHERPIEQGQWTGVLEGRIEVESPEKQNRAAEKQRRPIGDRPCPFRYREWDCRSGKSPTEQAQCEKDTRQKIVAGARGGRRNGASQNIDTAQDNGQHGQQQHQANDPSVLEDSVQHAWSAPDA